MRACLLTALFIILTAPALGAQLPSCVVIRAGGSLVVGDSIRGPWEMTGHDSFFEIVRNDGTGDYEMVLIDSPLLSVPSGTPVGRMQPLAEKGKFDLRLTVFDAYGRPKSYRTFVLSLKPDYSALSLLYYNRNRSISIDRLFPYLFRVGFTRSHPRPNDIDGARNLNYITRVDELVL